MRATIFVLWSGLFAAACYSPNPPLGVPCSSSHECPEGQECDLLTNVCGYPTESRTLRDDTAADFMAGTLDGALIEPGGFVGPIPYFVGGVRATGIQGNQLADDVDGTTFEQLAQLAPTGRGVLRSVDLELGDGVPALLGFTDGDDITILVEGEIFLDAGAYVFELRANDTGFLDVAAPGGAFERIGSAGTTAMQYPYTASAQGWYRFRGAFADATQFIEWELRYRIPNTGNIRSVPKDNVRCPVGDLDGVIVDVFDEAYMALYAGTGLADKLDNTFTGAPYGFPVGNGSYSVRWTGQFLLDAAGDYTFTIDTNQGQRVWIDGQEVANSYTGSARVTTTSPLALAAGWHDVVFDAIKTGGPMGRFLLTVGSGPQFAGGGIPRDHLRPVAGRVARVTSSANTTETDITDGMTITRSVNMDLPAGITTLAVDASYVMTHPLQAQLSMTLDPPTGSNIVLLAAGDLDGVGDYGEHVAVNVANAGTPYNFIAGDNLVDAMIGSVYWASVSTTYTGGRPPFEAMATYTSPVREIDAARFGAMHWTMRQAKESPLVSVRTCDEESECETARWTDVLDGEVPAVPARKYFQYKVVIYTDQNVPASLDSIELEYVGYIEP